MSINPEDLKIGQTIFQASLCYGFARWQAGYGGYCLNHGLFGLRRLLRLKLHSKSGVKSPPGGGVAAAALHFYLYTMALSRRRGGSKPSYEDDQHSHSFFQEWLGFITRPLLSFFSCIRG
jgi:hypothetical protein